MEFTLERSYFKEGTNGTLFVADQSFDLAQDKFICQTIELPWKDNQRSISCIPEGTYEILPRTSAKFKKHFMLKDVSNRTLILIHPANHAKRELRGCIAPVLYLSGIGKGLYSQKALDKLRFLIDRALENQERIFLIIKSANYEFSRTLSTTHTEIF
ncbi:DUF5675 family protein [uncultured Polaribacter sp.]|uniref:DUF5675 family protein n=1 Tax=uncultured Polaribacter sp. TaxID=174711 RepID=UPI0026056FA7|nr:DUF5675 family protein [uncultured Polaribacter sp.]